MLYDRWQRIAREYRNDFALIDLGSDRRWTFAELNAASQRSSASSEPVHFPQGNGADFVLETIAAWHADAVVCPLEAGQPRPDLRTPPPTIAHLKLTSATTGAARLVAFTAAQLAADVDNIVQTMGLRPDWPNLGVISLAHSYGFSNLVLPLLLHGIPLILSDSPLPESVRRGSARVESITLPAVPALWRAWHETDAIPRNVRLAISAGAPLPLPLEKEILQKTGLKVHNFYGATECGGIAYDPGTEPRAEAQCVGEAMQNVSPSVNAAGCLEVRGAAVGQSYWPAALSNLENGCYRTSDLAKIRNGLIFLRGRATDQINIAGRKISPEVIERALLDHPHVRECIVFGAPRLETERGEMVVACVAGSEECTGEALRQFLLTRLPAWQIPREWRFVEALAPNQRGKLSRAEWRTKLGFLPPA